MKRIDRILAMASVLALALTALSCSKPEEAPVPSGTAVPELVSSVPEDGASGIMGSSLSMVVTFDRNVLCPTAQQDRITVDNGAAIESVEAYMKDVTIVLSGLQGGMTYTVMLPSGTVTGYSGTAAEDISISFTTGESVSVEDQVIDENPVTEDAIPAVGKVYSYLRSIYGQKTLSGAMANVAWNTDEAEWAGKYTGLYPAIAFFDYIHLASSPTNWIDYGDITPALSWWNAGGLVGASWHWNVPPTSADIGNVSTYTFDADIDFSAAEAVKDGTWENTVIKADLEKISGYLKLLQDKGIPVLWRPLHEAAGNTYTQWHTGAWFWWGADGAQAYKDLWIYMFNWFRDAGIRNLIWVWTTQTSGPEDADFDFYPGDEYVDIIGKDIYNVSDASGIASQFTAVLQYSSHKMVTLSELGGIPDMGSCWDSGARWLYFMPWYDYANDGSENFAHGNADIAWWRSSFASDAVVSRDDLPAELFQ